MANLNDRLEESVDYVPTWLIAKPKPESCTQLKKSLKTTQDCETVAEEGESSVRNESNTMACKIGMSSYSNRFNSSSRFLNTPARASNFNN